MDLIKESWHRVRANSSMAVKIVLLGIITNVLLGIVTAIGDGIFSEGFLETLWNLLSWLISIGVNYFVVLASLHLSDLGFLQQENMDFSRMLKTAWTFIVLKWKEGLKPYLIWSFGGMIALTLLCALPLFLLGVGLLSTSFISMVTNPGYSLQSMIYNALFMGGFGLILFLLASIILLVIWLFGTSVIGYRANLAVAEETLDDAHFKTGLPEALSIALTPFLVYTVYLVGMILLLVMALWTGAFFFFGLMVFWALVGLIGIAIFTFCYNCVGYTACVLAAKGYKDGHLPAGTVGISKVGRFYQSNSEVTPPYASRQNPNAYTQSQTSAEPVSAKPADQPVKTEEKPAASIQDDFVPPLPADLDSPVNGSNPDAKE